MYHLMERKKTVLIVSVVLAAVCATTYGGPPLPMHQVEGYSGVFITPIAYLANPAEPNHVFGLPSISGTYAHLKKKDFESFVITENLWGPVELGYALERVGLGDWWDIALVYIVNDHFTVAGGYANFGNILNTREDNVWAIQVKYEF